MTDPAATNAGTNSSIKRLIICVCLVAGASMSVSASFNYMLTPMLDDFGLTSADASTALAIPSIASILVVFLAGSIGDRIGHRRVLLLGSAVFIIGSLIVSIANGLTLVSIGLLLEGIGATFLTVTSLGLLSSRITEDGARASAFSTFGMVSPVVYLALPVITGLVVEGHSWRLVPILWAVIGVLSAVAVLAMLPKVDTNAIAGSLTVPLLAGIALASGVQAIVHISDYGLLSLRVIIAAAISILALVMLVIIYRSKGSASFSLTPLRNPRTRMLMIVVMLVPFANTWYYMTIALQYMFGLSVLATAMAMIPAQLCGIVGAKALAGTLMRRRGVHHTGVLLLALLTLGTVSVLLVQADSPVWVPIACMSLFGLAFAGSGTVITNAFMSSAPATESGNTSAFKSSATSVGVALGFILMGSVVYGTAQHSLVNGFEQAGLDSTQATQQLTKLEQSSQNPNYISRYAYSSDLEVANVKSNVQSEEVVLELNAVAAGLHANALFGGVVALLATLIFAGRPRRHSKVPVL